MFYRFVCVLKGRQTKGFGNCFVLEKFNFYVASLPGLHCLNTVSYTHLDVYKRQGVTNAFTVIVIVFDVTVAEEGQVALLVMSQVTVCPFVSVVVVNVFPPDPAFTPFTFH